VLRLAQVALKSDEKNWQYRQMLGAALYRAGKFAEAVKELEQVAKPTKEGPWVWTRLFLAMAYQRLGQADNAREQFQQAVKQTAQKEPLAWHDKVTWRYLREEAETLLRARPPAKRPADEKR
jgi:Flp pilus assembly protein TadD